MTNRVIHKHAFDLADDEGRYTFPISASAEVIHFGLEPGPGEAHIAVWVDTPLVSEFAMRTFQILATGTEVQDDWIYHATTAVNGMLLHLYEVY